jgi:hypothetical protein
MKGKKLANIHIKIFFYSVVHLTSKGNITIDLLFNVYL